jgi:succinylglutamic semialdehyde dehydrogenase
VKDRIVSVSPADPTDELGRFPVWDAAAIHEAVLRARRAFPAWRDAGFEARASLLRRFRDFVRARLDGLALVIAREVGKALWDARAEAALVPAKVDVTLEHAMRLVAGGEAGAGARTSYFARGVLAVLGPFNFPAHLPNGHIVPALATGNTIVWKPSELSPAVGEWMARAWRDAGLPPGVLEVVHGRAETGRSLAVHPGVDGVLFTGSWATGRSLAEALLDQPGKILALEMGGKNAIVVLEDADLELALAETALSICATTGQRCSCASRLFVARSRIEEVAERLVDLLSRVRVGSPLDEHTFMGPLVSRAAFDKLSRYRGSSEAAGGVRLLEADPRLAPPFAGPGLVVFDRLHQTHAYQRDEIFGPEAALYPIDDLEQAIDAVNDSDFGLVASVFTRERAHYEHCVGRIRTGLLNWNRGTIGASGRLPFGGLKKSGNDRPAGIFSVLYCTVPQAHLETGAGFDPAQLPPGMPRP